MKWLFYLIAFDVVVVALIYLRVCREDPETTDEQRTRLKLIP